MKKLKKLLMIVLILVFTSLSSGCLAKLPVPEIKEGRFDFSVTYEINGEEKTYAGVYVCRYDGAYKKLAGKGIYWKGYIENDDNGGVIPIQNNEDGVIYIDLYFVPEYFMGDPDAILYDVPAPALYMVYHSDNPDEASYATEEEVIANYGIRIISYDYADPIENTFEEKLTFARFELTIN